AFGGLDVDVLVEANHGDVEILGAVDIGDRHGDELKLHVPGVVLSGCAVGCRATVCGSSTDNSRRRSSFFDIPTAAATRAQHLLLLSRGRAGPFRSGTG